ncbi:MAG: oligosaccharide flippase family protein [Sandaracinaceae bacterium]|nr:oligosaccharide flippase family protein [Sandaracinaceae bacterium]
MSTSASPNPSAYEKKATVGALVLLFQSGLAQLATLLGNLALARLLRPVDFGIFVMVQFTAGLFSLLGDIGLGPALIQKESAPTACQTSTAFFGQLGVASLVVALVWFSSPWLPSLWPEFPSQGPWILRALALAYFFNSLRSIPIALLERELRFVPIALIDSVDSIVFNGSAVFFAWLGFGPWALAAGTLIQSLSSLILALLFRPLKPFWKFDLDAWKSLLSFGVAHQLRVIVVFLTRSAVPLIGGTLFGAQAVGFINWALENGLFVLTFVNLLGRIVFPLLSRLQAETNHFRLALEQFLRVALSLGFGVGSVFVGLAEDITRIVFSDQWLPATSLFAVYAGGITLGLLPNVLIPVLYAVGKPHLALRFQVINGVLVWLLTAVGSLTIGMFGFALGHVVAMTAGSLLLWKASRPFFHLNGAPSLLRFYAGPLGAGIFVCFMNQTLLAPWVKDPLTLGTAVIASICAYLGALRILDPSAFYALVKQIRGSKGPNHSY